MILQVTWEESLKLAETILQEAGLPVNPKRIYNLAEVLRSHSMTFKLAPHGGIEEGVCPYCHHVHHA